MAWSWSSMTSHRCSCAEGRGLARGGAPAGTRDQEPAHADSTLRRAAPTPFHPGARTTRALVEECTTTIVGGVESLKVWWTSSPVRAHASAACGADRSARTPGRGAGARHKGLFTEVEFRRHFVEGLPRVGVDPGADSARRHQSRGQRHRGHGPPRRALTSRPSTTGPTASCALSSPTTAPAFRPPSASCSCRIIRPSSGAAVSAGDRPPHRRRAWRQHRRDRQHPTRDALRNRALPA